MQLSTTRSRLTPATDADREDIKALLINPDITKGL